MNFEMRVTMAPFEHCGIVATFIVILCCVVTNVQTIDSDVRHGTVFCEEEDIATWDWIYRYLGLSGNGLRCHFECPVDCTCILSNKTVTSDCDDTLKAEVTIQYPSDVTYLSWSGSVLHAIKPYAFLTLADSLHGLHLNYINLQYLQHGIFDGLNAVKYISLRNNHLTDIASSIFDDLQSLEWLDLFNNQFTEVAGAFTKVQSLERLHLSYNDLTKVAPGTFGHLSSLEYLYLSSNHITEVAPGSFSFLTSLEYLYLFNNQITEVIPGVFSNLTSLYKLHLGGNNLIEVARGSFSHLPRLADLHLNYNQIAKVEPGAFSHLSSLKNLYLYNNQITDITPGVFSNLTSLDILDLSSNKLTEVTLEAFGKLSNFHDIYLSHNTAVKLGELVKLTEIYLSNNQLTKLKSDVFNTVTQLTTIDLSNNIITEIAPFTSSSTPSDDTMYSSFGQLTSLRHLRLSYNQLSKLHSNIFQNQTMLINLGIDHNRLEFLPEQIFHNLGRLQGLDLSRNRLTRFPNTLFVNNTKLTYLFVYDNPLFWIEPDALKVWNKTTNLIVSSHSTCCFTSAECLCDKPKDPFLSCKRLLPYDSLRIAIWVLGTLAILGNIMVFHFRRKYRQHGNRVQDMLITNLAMSDFCMGIYLIMLVAADMYYKQYFPSFSKSWRANILCRIGGSISVLASEASAFFITLITIDRFLGVKYTFSKYRIRTRCARILVALMWIVALGISIASLFLSQGNADVYAVSEICVGLPISRQKRHTTDEMSLQVQPESKEWAVTIPYKDDNITGSDPAMHFSIGIFTGLNLACFFAVGYCYLAIFFSVRKTAGQAGRSTDVKEEIRMTLKMSVIVFTDFCCWVAIGIYSILVQTGAVEDTPVAYAWIATIALPINASINPFLYTLTSVISNKVERKEQETIPLRPMRGQVNDTRMQHM